MKNKNTLAQKMNFLFSVFILIPLFFSAPRTGSAYIVGTSSFQDSIWIFNDPSWTVFSGTRLTLSGFTVVGANSISWNSADGQYYAILRVSGFPRRLVTVNPETGVCTDIGSMGANFSSLTFTSGGVCYAIGGAGAGAFAERIYSINLTNGTPTFVAGPFPVGADGEVIAYNSSDNNIYHWSGNSIPNMEKIDAGTFVATAIPTSGFVHGEIYGAAYVGSGNFYATDISSLAMTVSTTGVFVLIASSLPDDIRGLGYGDPLLPVELASFTSTVNKRDVSLNWTTTSETNNSGFEIQRSAANGQWTRVAWISGKGTSVIPNNYTYADRNLNSGSYSYRLKQVDYNGAFEYFNLNNEVVIGAPDRFAVSQNYPNPFNPVTKINFDLPYDSKVSIKLFDISGKEISTLTNNPMSSGYHTISFDASSLTSGVYFYRISAEGNGNKFTETKRMMLVK